MVNYTIVIEPFQIAIDMLWYKAVVGAFDDDLKPVIILFPYKYPVVES